MRLCLDVVSFDWKFMLHSEVPNIVWGPCDGCSIFMSCFPIEADGHRMSCQEMFMHIVMYVIFTSTYTATKFMSHPGQHMS